MPSTATGATPKLLVGYPDEGICHNGFVPYHLRLDVFPAGAEIYGYRDEATTYAGMSGGPLLVRDANGALNSYGIHVRDPLPEARTPPAACASHPAYWLR